ncbi:MULTISPECIES: GDYXXLXY domain-containing protein [Limibacillus]|jgi:uncharacterized membrane-anchored protein|uniref:Putative membrane-anchored protein n=1 Tax=Limibacillus halophilus TaxID=1579333 RepID=A0A839SWG1_9PROT|nr:GDYXXLXY domain-containing protein [Limibacillus halophilus]MBB3065293.1 putative membrane-anchored protein [Limibacillus halophilus]
MNRRALDILGVLAGLVLVLGLANWNILAKQSIVETGQKVLLPLQPVDPRSLIQGDYMRLDYSPDLHARGEIPKGSPRKGTAIMLLDSDGVARFQRFDDESPLAPSEVRLRYKLVTDAGRMRYGAESFFFQEGQRQAYQVARFGVLHVASDGTSVLIGLADENRALIVPE